MASNSESHSFRLVLDSTRGGNNIAEAAYAMEGSESSELLTPLEDGATSRGGAAGNVTSGLLQRPVAKLRGFGKAQRVLVTLESENAQLEAKHVLSPEPSAALSSPARGAWPAIANHAPLEALKPQRRAAVHAHRPPATPESSIMARIFEAPGSVEASGSGASPMHTSRIPAASALTLSAGISEDLSPIDRQQAALQAWMNSVLCPPGVDGGSVEGSAARRLAARMRGRLWGVYRNDSALRQAMVTIEQRLESGSLQPQRAVSLWIPSQGSTCPFHFNLGPITFSVFLDSCRNRH